MKSDPAVIISGTTALDTIKTPFGSVTDALGGSGVYAGTAANLFAPVGIVSVTGKDFPREHTALLKKRFDLQGLAVTGKTFRWKGEYRFAMDEAITKKTELGSLAGWKPEVPASYKKVRVFFLGNLDPEVQHQMLDWAHAQHPRAYLMLDTMNYWITSAKKRLLQAIKRVDALVINDGEARMITGSPNLVRAGQLLLEQGPQVVIIKKGEHGALLFGEGKVFFAFGGLAQEPHHVGVVDQENGVLVGGFGAGHEVHEPFQGAQLLPFAAGGLFASEHEHGAPGDGVEGLHPSVAQHREPPHGVQRKTGRLRGRTGLEQKVDGEEGNQDEQQPRSQ